MGFVVAVVVALCVSVCLCFFFFKYFNFFSLLSFNVKFMCSCYFAVKKSEIYYWLNYSWCGVLEEGLLYPCENLKMKDKLVSSTTVGISLLQLALLITLHHNLRLTHTYHSLHSSLHLPSTSTDEKDVWCMQASPMAHTHYMQYRKSTRPLVLVLPKQTGLIHSTLEYESLVCFSQLKSTLFS